MSNFNLNNDLLRKIVSKQLEKKKAAPNKLSASYVEGMVQEEIENVIDEMLGRTDERYQGEGAAPNMLEWWKEDPDKIMSFVYWLKGQLPPSDPEQKKTAWDNLAQQLEKRHPSPDGAGAAGLQEEEEGEEEASETGTGEQQDAAKEQGFKPDVVKVAKFMFKHKQLGPALGKLKGDKIESAQLMVLLAQELGIEAGDLQKMQVQMKAAMTKAEK